MALEHARHDAQDDLKAELGRQLNLWVSFLKIVGQTKRAFSRSAAHISSACQNQTIKLHLAEKQMMHFARPPVAVPHRVDELIY